MHMNDEQMFLYKFMYSVVEFCVKFNIKSVHY